jgi:hypothetical protein
MKAKKKKAVEVVGLHAQPLRFCRTGHIVFCSENADDFPAVPKSSERVCM